MSMDVKKIAVTGAAGQIAYPLVFRIAQGDLLGKNQKISLHLLDLPHCFEALQGLKMELEDSHFPLLEDVVIGSDPLNVFEEIDIALLIGAKPRGKGMERKDLLLDNAKIFVEQGKALNKVASKNAFVFVVGNPCNTNCLITMHHAYNIPKENFHAMMRLDEHRAKFQLAKKAKVSISDVKDVIIWGNHSKTQVPDFINAKILEKGVENVIADRNWLENVFFSTVQNRGSAIIAARGKSSAASAAHALICLVRSVLDPTDDMFSSAIYTDKNPYGIKNDLIFSLPCIATLAGKIEIVKNLKWDSFLEEKIKISEKELLEEKEQIAHLL